MSTREEQSFISGQELTRARPRSSGRKRHGDGPRGRGSLVKLVSGQENGG